MTPRVVVEFNSVAYVVAHCHHSGIAKTFRLDRIRKCRLEEEGRQSWPRSLKANALAHSASSRWDVQPGRSPLRARELCEHVGRTIAAGTDPVGKGVNEIGSREILKATDLTERRRACLPGPNRSSPGPETVSENETGAGAHRHDTRGTSFSRLDASAPKHLVHDALQTEGHRR
jgi:WYL domain